MNNKTFIKLGNRTFNFSKIDYIDFFKDKLIIEIKLDSESYRFKLNNELTFERFHSLIRMYSTEFECEIEKIEDKKSEEKKILND